MNKVLVSLICLLCAANQSFALVTLPESMKQAMKGTPDTPGLFNIVASLLIVIVLIYFVGWLYTKLSHINSKSIFKAQKVAELNKPKIISGITLGQNRNLYVVELNGRYLVLGVTPNNVNLIKEFDKNEVKNTDEILKQTIEADFEQNVENKEEKVVDILFKEPQPSSKDTELEDICKKYIQQ